MVPVNAMAPSGTPTNEGTYSQQSVIAYSVVPEKPIEKPKSALGRTVPLSVACSCINYVKARLGGISEVWGTPNRMAATSTEPYIGGVVITTEGPVGHVAYIESINDGVLTVSESNYERCKITTREIPIDYSKIRGYK